MSFTQIENDISEKQSNLFKVLVNLIKKETGQDEKSIEESLVKNYNKNKIFVSQIKKEEMPTKVIVVSCQEEFDVVKKAMKLGAYDYLRKLNLSSDELENILHFRRDDLESYFEKTKEDISPSIKFFASIFKYPVKNYLQSKSEPLQALKGNDKELIERFFGEKPKS